MGRKNIENPTGSIVIQMYIETWWKISPLSYQSLSLVIQHVFLMDFKIIHNIQV
jgi:hypothetical protein